MVGPRAGTLLHVQLWRLTARDRGRLGGPGSHTHRTWGGRSKPRRVCPRCLRARPQTGERGLKGIGLRPLGASVSPSVLGDGVLRQLL